MLGRPRLALPGFVLLLVSGCSLLAPKDDELLGGGTDGTGGSGGGNGGATGGTSAAGGSGANGGTGALGGSGGSGGGSGSGGSGATGALGGSAGSGALGGTAGVDGGGVGGGGVGGSSGSGGSGGGVTDTVGCADGQREGFLDPSGYAKIAACGGGFTVPGTKTAPSMTPQCNRQAGDDGSNPHGTGCSVADFCALGWHVCNDKADVQKAVLSCSGAGNNGFWATRQVMSMLSQSCSTAPTDTNNVVGCGSGGLALSGQSGCQPLTRAIRSDDCPNEWDCGPGNLNTTEALVVTKPEIDGGGVLCCLD